MTKLFNRNFGRYKYVGALEILALPSRTKHGFILVRLGTIKMPVASCHGRRKGLIKLGRIFHLPQA